MAGGEEDEATTAAVCLALDLSTLAQDLDEALRLSSTLLQHQGSTAATTAAAAGGGGGLQIKPLAAGPDARPQPAAAPAGTAAASPPGSGRGSKRKARSGGAGGSAAAAAAGPPGGSSGDEAQARARYVALMQPFRFLEADLLAAGHYFARDAAASRVAAGGEQMRRRLKRITEELGALSTSLPIDFDSSILLAVHADRMDLLRALLLPPPDTPYACGAFVFDILLPPEYPNKPPRVGCVWCLWRHVLQSLM